MLTNRKAKIFCQSPSRRSENEILKTLICRQENFAYSVYEITIGTRLIHEEKENTVMNIVASIPAVVAVEYSAFTPSSMSCKQRPGWIPATCW